MSEIVAVDGRKYQPKQKVNIGVMILEECLKAAEAMRPAILKVAKIRGDISAIDLYDRHVKDLKRAIKSANEFAAYTEKLKTTVEETNEEVSDT